MESATGQNGTVRFGGQGFVWWHCHQFEESNPDPKIWVHQNCISEF